MVRGNSGFDDGGDCADAGSDAVLHTSGGREVLPASGALGSLMAGIFALASGRLCRRFLIAAAALVTAIALTLAIEAMLRLP